MKLARVGIIAIAVLAISSVAFAQKPDFSGTWTVDTSAMPAPATPPAGTPPAGEGARGGGRGMMAGPMTVVHKGDTLTIERMQGENKIVSVYKLDGTESVNKMMAQGAAIETKSMAKWDGNKLMISTKRPGQDGTMVETSQTWWLDGGTLTVESTNARGTQKRVYKKTT